MSQGQQNAGAGERPYYGQPYQGYDQPYPAYDRHSSYDQSRQNYDQSQPQPHQSYDQRRQNQNYRDSYYDQAPPSAPAPYSDKGPYADNGPYYDQSYANDPLPPRGSEKIEVSGGDPSGFDYDPYGPPQSRQFSDSANSHPIYEDELRYGERERAAPDDSRYIASKNNAPFRAQTGVYSRSPTQSEAKLLVGSDSLQRTPPKRLTCWDYTLCRCWPRWARWICCSCLLIFLGLLIAIAVIAATFKVPIINMNGVTSQPNVPDYAQNGTSFSFNFALKIGVVNNNIIGATFEKIAAVAYYPIGQTRVGSGELTNVNFPSHSTTNLTFPFSITYDPTLDKDQTILSDIASRCGLLGAPKTPISVNYAVTLYLRILFVTVTPPPFRQSTSIDCPIQDGQLPQGLNLSGLSAPTGIPTIPGPAPTATS